MHPLPHYGHDVDDVHMEWTVMYLVDILVTTNQLPQIGMKIVVGREGDLTRVIILFVCYKLLYWKI